VLRRHQACASVGVPMCARPSTTPPPPPPPLSPSLCPPPHQRCCSSHRTAAAVTLASKRPRYSAQRQHQACTGVGVFIALPSPMPPPPLPPPPSPLRPLREHCCLRPQGGCCFHIGVKALQPFSEAATLSSNQCGCAYVRAAAVITNAAAAAAAAAVVPTDLALLLMLQNRCHCYTGVKAPNMLSAAAPSSL
jgi:hypothetical protein